MSNLIILLSSTDLGNTPEIVLAIYLLILLGLGIFGYLKSKGTEEDYYLAGRGQGLLVTSLTIMATFFSGVALLGFPGLVYEHGVSSMFLALNLPVAGAAVYLLGNGIRKLGQARGYVTPGDMIAGYYGGTGIRFVVAVLGILYVLPYIIIQIKAGGMLAQQLFGENMFDFGAAALSLVTLIYVLVGGMRSVAWTDVLQGILLLSGALLAGAAVVVSLGGVEPFFSKVAELDPKQLTMHDPKESKWNPWWILTFCLFGSLASIVQPAQWMRFYAAKSSKTLRQSAVIFAVVLPACFLFGVMLVGLVGRAVHPPIDPNLPLIDSTGSPLLFHPENLPEGLNKSDQIAVFMLSEQLPAMLGGLGVILVSIIMVAIMAASMSTADSNLHALGGVITRDFYDRINPNATEKQRAWVGRIVIIITTAIALGIVSLGENTNFGKGLLQTIAEFFFLAMAFSCQLVPSAIDILYIRKGTRIGAIAGMCTGGAVVLATFIFSSEEGIQYIKRLIDLGCLAVTFNVLVFVIVSKLTQRVDPSHIASFERDLS
ncbi:MAG: sodium:solute symporter family protein [Verrucomicrobiales bacterium]|nr:sodium:solute symporter family protein [Verrucomicrobiales bacterium]